MSASAMMKKKTLILLLFSFWNCASSVEFIPDPDYVAENPYYSKTKPEDIEILSSKPTRDFKIAGTVIFRNFVNPTDMQSELHTLQREMFQLKMDGVWIYKKTVENIPPLIINTQNEHGMVVAYNETNREMGKLMGYPFRYRKIPQNDPTKVR